MRLTLTSLLACALLLVSLGAQAQPPAGPGPGFAPGDDAAQHRGHRLRFLIRALDLTQEQEEAVTALHQEMVAAVEPLIQELRLLRTDLQGTLEQPDPEPLDVGELTLAIHRQRQAIDEERQTFRSGVEALLTPEQLERLAELEERRPGRGRGPRAGRGGGRAWGGGFGS